MFVLIEEDMFFIMVMMIVISFMVRDERMNE